MIGLMFWDYTPIGTKITKMDHVGDLACSQPLIRLVLVNFLRHPFEEFCYDNKEQQLAFTIEVDMLIATLYYHNKFSDGDVEEFTNHKFRISCMIDESY